MTAYLCDSNVWLALFLSAHANHVPARDWLGSVEDPQSIVLCRAAQQSLLRLLTTRAVLAPYGTPPLTNLEAWNAYATLLSDDRVVMREDEPPHLEATWRELTQQPTASPKLWTDAYLAAFATTGNYRLVTSDAAFRQFNGLDLVVLSRAST